MRGQRFGGGVTALRNRRVFPLVRSPEELLNWRNVK